MSTALPNILAAAGGTFIGSRVAGAANRKNQVQYETQSFNQRMRDAEKYGIHPLQAIGSAGTLQGTGGTSISSMIENERQSRSFKKARNEQWKREDRHRLEDKEHQMTLESMKHSAKDTSIIRELWDNMRNPNFSGNASSVGQIMRHGLQEMKNEAEMNVQQKRRTKYNPYDGYARGYP